MFTFESYETLLKEIKEQNKYFFLRFDQESPENEKRLIYLRHDVDISPDSALKLGEIEKKLNIKANYFFQIGAETYNVFSLETKNIIQLLFSMGHCVGLHIDESIFGDNEEKIHETLNWFNNCIINIHFVVSFHRPSKSMLYRKFKHFTSAYQADFFSEDKFLSDSRKNKEFYPKLIKLLEEKKSPIQLLLHPAWWSSESDIIKFTDNLIERRILELKKYLKTNFKNLEGYINDENSNLRL